jgi:hypothetical protein
MKLDEVQKAMNKFIILQVVMEFKGQSNTHDILSIGKSNSNVQLGAL